MPDNQPIGELYSAIITEVATGLVIEVATYYHATLAEETVQDSSNWKTGNRFTLVNHNDDGSSDVHTTRLCEDRSK